MAMQVNSLLSQGWESCAQPVTKNPCLGNPSKPLVQSPLNQWRQDFVARMKFKRSRGCKIFPGLLSPLATIEV